MSLSELKEHLHTLPNQPDAIPFLTSYYERRWGFCLSQNDLLRLRDGQYHVKIDSSIERGSLTYGELILEGETDKEVLLSTYVCHPSMANDNLSGLAVTTYLTRYLMSVGKRRYTYRIIFVPETIGAIVYLSKHKDHMKEKTIAGYVITCLGDPANFTYLKSRKGNTLVDKVTQHALKFSGHGYSVIDYTHRQSDERQYCSPGIDLPVGSLMRTKYGGFPEYHTSLDDLNLVRRGALDGSLKMYQACLEMIEANRRLMVTVYCEPQLGKRGLYPSLGSQKDMNAMTEDIMALVSYCDGENDLIDIAERHGKTMRAYLGTAESLLKHDLLRYVDE